MPDQVLSWSDTPHQCPDPLFLISFVKVGRGSFLCSFDTWYLPCCLLLGEIVPAGSIFLGCGGGWGSLWDALEVLAFIFLWNGLWSGLFWLVGTARAAAGTFSCQHLWDRRGFHVGMSPSLAVGLCSHEPGSLASQVMARPCVPGFLGTLQALAGVQVFPSTDAPALLQSLTH